MLIIFMAGFTYFLNSLFFRRIEKHDADRKREQRKHRWLSVYWDSVKGNNRQKQDELVSARSCRSVLHRLPLPRTTPTPLPKRILIQNKANQVWQARVNAHLTWLAYVIFTKLPQRLLCSSANLAAIRWLNDGLIFLIQLVTVDNQLTNFFIRRQLHRIFTSKLNHGVVRLM